MKFSTILHAISSVFLLFVRAFLSLLLWPLTILALLLSSCATTAPPALHQKVAQADEIFPAQSSVEQKTGLSVRWGGRIIETLPENGRTCFQIMARPLKRDGRPAADGGNDDPHLGRFLACHAGFYDPAIYSPGRDMTVLGKISSHPSVRIGDYDYVLPHVEIDFLYLWPLLPEIATPPPYNTYYYPYGPWGPWYPWGRW